jgi:hypothetical protein
MAIRELDKYIIVGDIDITTSTIKIPLNAFYFNTATGDIMFQGTKDRQFKLNYEPEVIKIDSDTALEVGNVYYADTSDNALLVSLPLVVGKNQPLKLNDTITIIDQKGTFATNNLTILHGDYTLNGDADDLDLDVSNKIYRLIYMENDEWRVI